MAMGSAGVALVTGGSRGLGREVALALRREGYRVAVNYLEDEGAAREVAGLVGGMALRADVSDAARVSEMALEVGERFGRVDVIVNNAGVTADSLLARQTVEQWDRLVGVNLRGCFNVTRSLAPLMAASGGGHIVNVSSRSAIRGKAGQAAYSASKAALLGLTRTLAAELSGDGIKVNAVLPGYMRTSMGAAARRAEEEATRESLLGVLSSPLEAASFISWLVSTNGVTGQVFSLDSRI